MSRWIDAEYCEDFFDRWESRVKNAEPVTIDVVQNTRILLRDAPSIDMVRCKDCKHKYQEPWHDGVAVEGECEIWHNATLDNDFCSYGERKNNDQGRTAGESNIK